MSNTRTDWNKTDSDPAFGGIRLSSSEQDEVLLSLTDYLIDKKLGEFASNTLNQIQDKECFKAIYCSARIHVLLGEQKRAVEEFEQLIDMDDTFIDAYV